jgi:hypothetical protein
MERTTYKKLFALFFLLLCGVQVANARYWRGGWGWRRPYWGWGYGWGAPYYYDPYYPYYGAGATLGVGLAAAAASSDDADYHYERGYKAGQKRAKIAAERERLEEENAELRAKSSKKDK